MPDNQETWWKKERITDYFTSTDKPKSDTSDMKMYFKSISETYRKKFDSSNGTLNERICAGLKSGDYWEKHTYNGQKVTFEHVVNDEISLQDKDGEPIFIGGRCHWTIPKFGSCVCGENCCRISQNIKSRI